MAERQTTTESGHRTRRGLPVRLLAVVVIAALSVYLLVKLALLTPYPAAALGGLLSDYTGQKVTVGSVSWIGGTLLVEGIAVANPPGFRERNLLSVATLRLTPDPAGVLMAGRRLSQLYIRGVRLDLERGSAGEWNYARLLQRLKAGKKRPGREFFIKRLVLRDVALLVNGRTVDKLGLAVNDLSTTGTTESRLVFSFGNTGGSPVLLTAEGKLGPAPLLRARLRADHLPLAPLVSALPGGFPVKLEQASSSLDLAAEYRGSLLSARGRVGFAGLGLKTASAAPQLGGGIEFSGSYDTKGDRVVLERALLSVEKLLSLKAAGFMERVRKDGRFVLTFSHEPIALGGLMGLLPEQSRRGVSLEGTIVSRGLRLEGSRSQGISSCQGTVSLRSARIARQGRALLSRGGADLVLKRMDSGWLAAGRIFASGRGEAALIESLNAPFNVRLSSRFKPARVEFPDIVAAVGGGSLNGSFTYLPAGRPRLKGEWVVRNLPLASLDRFLEGAKLHVSSGTGSASVSLSGVSPKEFTGRVAVALSAAAGTTAGRKFSIRSTELAADLRRGAGGFSANGRAKAAGGVVDGRPFGASSELSFAGNLLKLAKAELEWAGSRTRIGNAAVRLPAGGERNAGGWRALAATAADVEFSRGDLSLAGGSGELDCRYYSAGEERRLEGGGTLRVGSLSFRDRKVASLTGRLSFDGRDIKASILGDALGGSLVATVAAAPFSPGKQTTFTARLRELKMDRLPALLPGNKGPLPSGGGVDMALDGSWDRDSGVRGRVSLAGRDLALRGAGNRTLASGFGLALESTLSGPDLQLKEAVLKRDGGPVIRVGGAVKRFAGADREGELTFSMASTPLNSMLDAFVNALPKALQEASGGGACELEGSAAVKGKSVMLNGGISLRSVSLEIPSQKVLVADIDGRIPFSLAYPRREQERKPPGLSFSKENYPILLRTFERSAGTGSRLRVGRTRFGALDIGEMNFSITAQRGAMEISPLRVSLYDGYLTGHAFLLYDNGFSYGADLLLHDLSLRQFCDSFPKIKGYMSGRVDGVISLVNAKGGTESAAGFVNLWTRSGKGEKMLVSKEFLQKLAGKKLKGFLFQNDRAYDNAEIIAYLRGGFLTFERLDISHTNFLGMKDLSVSVAPVQNRIALEHLLESIREAAARGKVKGEGEAPPVQTDLKWLE